MATPFSINPVPIQAVNAAWIPAGIKVSMLRTDLVDTLLSGNKYFKLLPNLARARELQLDCLLSFGGAWSNHLHALAAAGQHFGFRTIGVIRGEQHNPLNPCLEDMHTLGMQLEFVSRTTYRHYRDPDTHDQLQARYGPCYVIPEGGSNRLGILGCQHMVPADLPEDVSHLMLACGTGTTFAGIITSTTLPVYGISAVKGEGYLQTAVQHLLDVHSLQPKSHHWRMYDNFHRGGFARTDADLFGQIQQFEADTGILLEPVYSGKLLMALQNLLAEGEFPEGSHIVLVHGGGLQGRRGFRAFDQD